MIAAIHQPQYLPWLGYFDKIASADVFILLDNVQFKKNEWQNRNKIRTAQGWQWLTVPVIHDFGQRISQVKINDQVKWREAHFKALCLNYRRAPFYDLYIGQFREIYDRPWDDLGDINIFMVQKIVQWLGISTRILVASQYETTEHHTQRLIDLCRAAGADTYLSGADGKSYMDLDRFQEAGISLQVQDFHHPLYSQVWAGKNSENFLSHMSVIDLLFNCGPESLKLLRGLTGTLQKI